MQRGQNRGRTGRGLLLLCLLFAFLLSSCASPTLLEGIELSADDGSAVAHAPVLRESMRHSLYGILLAAKGQGTVTPDIATELRREAEAIETILATAPLGEGGYAALADLLEEKKGAVVHLVTGASGRDEVEDLYRALRATVGREYLGEVLYGLAMRYYTVRYEQQMALYEERGHAYLLTRANEYLAATEILRADITPVGLAEITDLLFFFGAFLYGDALPAEGMIAFTDEELLFLLRRLDIDTLGVGVDGWSLILTALGNARLTTANKRFLDKVAFAAAKNGDTLLLAEEMPALLSLLGRVRDRLTAEDIAPLRSGNTGTVLSVLLSHCNEEDFAVLANLEALPIHADEYSRLAEGFYGEGYLTYLANCKTATLDELRAAVGSETIEETMKGYIAGICPAFAYDPTP